MNLLSYLRRLLVWLLGRLTGENVAALKAELVSAWHVATHQAHAAAHWSHAFVISTNYTADDEVHPKTITFANGRVVRVVRVGTLGCCLEVGWASDEKGKV